MQKKVALAECWSSRSSTSGVTVRIRSVVNRDGDRSVRRGGGRQMRPVRSQQLASGPQTRRGQDEVIDDNCAQHPWPQVRTRQQRDCGAGMQRKRRLDQPRSASSGQRFEAAALDCSFASWTNWLSRKSAHSRDQTGHSWPPGTTCTSCGSSAAAIMR